MSTSKSSSSLALFFALNLIFFTLVSSCNTCPNPPKPKPKPKPKPVPCPPPPSPHKTCPTLKLGVCGNLLNGLIGIIIGTPDRAPCCTLIDGLADLDAAVCLCTALKANVLGIVVDIPLSLNLLLNACGKKSSPGFKCG